METGKREEIQANLTIFKKARDQLEKKITDLITSIEKSDKAKDINVLKAYLKDKSTKVL